MLDQVELPVAPEISLAWIRVAEAVRLLWDGNPKSHDLGGIMTSIDRYGFRELPVWEPGLPNVSGDMGAIQCGNGRIEALAKMEQGEYSLPAGLAHEKDTGAWVLPIVVGPAAETEEDAVGYAIDSNMLIMSGGDLELRDMLRAWDTTALAEELDQLAPTRLPVSFDGEDLDDLHRMMDAMKAPREDQPAVDSPADGSGARGWCVLVCGLEEGPARALATSHPGATLKDPTGKAVA